MRRFQVFTVLWCGATLLHQLYQGRLLVIDAATPLTFAALFAIARPSDLSRFSLLLVIQLATVIWELPRVSNHWLLMGVTSAGLLIALLPALRAERRGGAVEASLEAALGPVRVQIVIVYLWATFHKLNAGFFDPELSCGVEHYTRLASSLGFLPDGPWTHAPAIAATLVIEALLPLLIAIRSTRWAALPLGWAFHLGLGWNGYWDFSSVAFAYYATCLPPWAFSGYDRARARHAWLASGGSWLARIGRSRLFFPVAASGLAACLGIAWLADADGPHAILAVNRLGRFAWLALWLALGLTLAVSLIEGRAFRTAQPERVSRWWRRPALWIAPAIVLANGFSPYLGLKSENSFAMFSNLRVEGTAWNHYLMPRRLRVFGYADEVIRLQKSSDPYLQTLARHGFGLVPLELRSYLALRPDTAVTYLRQQRRIATKRAGDDPFLLEPVHPLARKLILFRPVPPNGKNACRH